MKFLRIGKRFARDEDGAVTVDWVVLTAALVTLGLVTMNIIRGGVYDAASDIYSSLTAVGN